jgi:hypothetical protein
MKSIFQESVWVTQVKREFLDFFAYKDLILLILSFLEEEHFLYHQLYHYQYPYKESIVLDLACKWVPSSKLPIILVLTRIHGFYLILGFNLDGSAHIPWGENGCLHLPPVNYYYDLIDFGKWLLLKTQWKNDWLVLSPSVSGIPSFGRFEWQKVLHPSDHLRTRDNPFTIWPKFAVTASLQCLLQIRECATYLNPDPTPNSTDFSLGRLTCRFQVPFSYLFEVMAITNDFLYLFCRNQSAFSTLNPPTLVFKISCLELMEGKNNIILLREEDCFAVLEWIPTDILVLSSTRILLATDHRNHAGLYLWDRDDTPIQSTKLLPMTKVLSEPIFQIQRFGGVLLFRKGSKFVFYK